MTVVLRNEEDQSEYARHIDAMRDAIREAVQRLPEPENSIVIGLWFERQSRMEMAAQLQIPTFKVDVLHHTACARMQKTLSAMRQDGSDDTFNEAFDAILRT